MGLFTHILISEVERAHRAKVKQTQAALDRVVREMLANDPRPLWPDPPAPAPRRRTGR